MLSALNSLKDSAQSPAWRTKARPPAASAERGGQVAGLAGEDQRGKGAELGVDPLQGVLVGPRGCCAAACDRHESGVQVEESTPLTSPAYGVAP